jgi:transposase InsO family protein
MDKNQKTRLGWIQLYQTSKDAGYVCRRCGISRPTLRKWLKRYNENGLEGLSNKSCKPINSPSKKIFDQEESLILDLRNSRKLGVRRMQSELLRLHNISLSLASIHKVLKRNNIPYLQKKRYYRKQAKRYSCKVPGERVQIDVCKIANGLYQYTAIDDCTRFRVLELYSRRTAANTLDFLEQMLERFPFPIQRIQTDRGKEFFAYKVQQRFMDWHIKFRPIKPASPHLNGKVERSQRTDLDEFYSTVDIKCSELKTKLLEWEFYYNWHRSHSSLSGKTPIEKYCELINQTPIWEDVENGYNPANERIKEQNYYVDSRLVMLK